jgi:hypothetical protein
MDRLKNIRVKIDSNSKRNYRHIKYPEIPLSAQDIYIMTSGVDRLDSLANRFYNDTELWWIIASANPSIIKGDGFGLKPGLTIRIPNNPEVIVQSFYRINQ